MKPLQIAVMSNATENSSNWGLVMQLIMLGIMGGFLVYIVYTIWYDFYRKG